MPEADTGERRRTKPHSAEAESSVLGGLYIDNDQIRAVADILPDGKSFYNSVYGSIYEAMLALYRKGSAIDMVTLKDKLKEKDVPPEVVSEGFLRDVISAVPTSANVKYYADIVAEKALMRELLREMEKLSEDCYSGRELNELLEDTEKRIFAVVQKRTVENLTPTPQIVMNTLEQIDAAARTKGDVTGLGSGFTDLDHKTTGFRAGNLVLVAARPAMGKTSLVLSMLHQIAVKKHKPALMFSLEMSETELMMRLLSMDSNVDSQNFKTGQLSETEWELLTESGGNLAHAPVYLSDRVSTLGEVSSIARKYRAEKNIELVVIDYLQLMNSANRRADSRQQEISEISRGLKLLAKELGIPIIALSQLSRGVESRTDHRPMLSDLRESGAIEQDADIVLFIYRDEMYNADTDKKNIAEIIIAKNRSGPTGTVELVWIPELTQYKNKEYR